MILIVTHKDDYTADFVINKLNERKIEYYRLNSEDIPQFVDISISSNNSFIPEIANLKYIKSVWFRRVKYPVDLNLDKDTLNYYYGELNSFLKNLWQLTESRWLSHPDYINRAENKLLQLKKAAEIGFCIPDTLVSVNSVSIRDFYYKHSKIIIKPLFNGKYVHNKDNSLIYTSVVLEKDLEDLDQSIKLHNIYQEYINKDVEIRVTVVNNNVFAAYVDSQNSKNTEIDWRKEKMPFSLFNLPDDVSKKCIQLVNDFNLSFGAIDLIKDTNGEYVFLEINPNGQWAWIEMDTGLMISDAIIKYLNYENS